MNLQRAAFLIATVATLYWWQMKRKRAAPPTGGAVETRITTSTLGSDGLIVQSLAYLAAQAAAAAGRPVSIETYALARMIGSETGANTKTKTVTDAEKIAVAHVALNDAREKKWSLLYTLLGPKQRFREQAGWRYATSRDPTLRDLRIAERVLARETTDPTGGAVKFVHEKGFATPAKYREVVAKWATEGLRGRELANTNHLIVFVRTARAVA